MYQNSKDCQIEPVEIDNFLNFEVYVMFPQASNDMYFKTITFKLLGCQSRHSVGIEGGFVYSNGFDKLLLTCILKRLRSNY